MLREVVHAVNDLLHAELTWPVGEAIPAIAVTFQGICRLPSVIGTIDGTYFGICKPRVSASNYYYFKFGGYTVTCQAVVDSQKCFLDLYVGMPGSTNDARVLRMSTLFYCDQ